MNNPSLLSVLRSLGRYKSGKTYYNMYLTNLDRSLLELLDLISRCVVEIRDNTDCRVHRILSRTVIELLDLAQQRLNPQ